MREFLYQVQDYFLFTNVRLVFAGVYILLLLTLVYRFKKLATRVGNVVNRKLK